MRSPTSNCATPSRRLVVAWFSVLESDWSLLLPAAISRILGSAGLLSALSFSRDQERDSDSEGLAAVAAVYGHVAGSDEIFGVFRDQMNKLSARPPGFLLTHPLDDERIRSVVEMASREGWSLSGDQTEIPPKILDAIRDPAGSDTGSDES